MPPDFDEFVNETMESLRPLANARGDLGGLEVRFQKLLDAQLAARYGRDAAVREHAVLTARTLNKRVIRPDHLIRYAGCIHALELKCVKNSRSSGVPKNAPAFGYDLIKDCAKIEILVGQHVEAGKLTGSVVGGVVLGLTDHTPYWHGRTSIDWALEFNFPDKGGWAKLGRSFGPHATNRALCIHPKYYMHKRYRIVLRNQWEYRWYDFKGDFRYIMLRRKSVVEQGLEILPQDRNITLPFADAVHREAANKERLEYNRQYRESGNAICPICGASRP
ncbi:hypothetical protein [Sphingomonas azotifigens]|uniref:hypothetical protein n=1 Tax=Sphingomonas azotifigens TaxID=330920 RepID=UPI00111BE53E|nr:hypothetical protein [Sphingomonas azotifigens]